VRDLEIDPATFTPPDQMRPWARRVDDQLTMYPAQMLAEARAGGAGIL